MLKAEKTIPYKTFVKRGLVEALRRVFNAHVDDLLQGTKVTIEHPFERSAYPSVVVRFYERELANMGVGHRELLRIGARDYLFEHYRYTGDIEFGIYALSSLDRDLIADSVVQTLAMGKLTDYTDHFFDRIYDQNLSEKPEAKYNYINLNTDEPKPIGETQAPAPWQGSEDDYVYQTGYRVDIMGEFYSLPPDVDDNVGFIEDVTQYPYIGGLEAVPEGADDPSPWVPEILDLEEPE